jgi:hypothetical protein
MLAFRLILCPSDFSEPSQKALEAADELASHFSAELLLDTLCLSGRTSPPPLM